MGRIHRQLLLLIDRSIVQCRLRRIRRTEPTVMISLISMARNKGPMTLTLKSIEFSAVNTCGHCLTTGRLRASFPLAWHDSWIFYTAVNGRKGGDLNSVFRQSPSSYNTVIFYNALILFNFEISGADFRKNRNYSAFTFSSLSSVIILHYCDKNRSLQNVTAHYCTLQCVTIRYYTLLFVTVR